jgi:hypothetical protein
MNITEKIDCIKINQDKSIYVRKSVNTFKDGVLIDFVFRQKTINVGDDYSLEDTEVQAICSEIHVPEVVTAYHVMQKARIPSQY